ncbi:hypothetical protein BME96_03020 [Virgibacillus halodenitrificans]|uniref:DUF4129 domain-containing protein n=1 Tax=Virgibacillus halodenitrificans TaxID=1482 RepID=A0AAC9NK17_VIRHA|nr:hypothetical protein [Virgibacillus halodenitrificans]APC47214.1 hypothetical protein BME96_03020 [Virgibacillus halodenitrificans]MCJ0931942.1 hypothetical protein [Virgibacillus halodenitrificans]CDQ36742.1 hypothetical protein BN993_06253 [Virgibacillus halodenitrificans]
MIKQNELIVLYYQLISEYLLFYLFLHPILIATNTSISYGVYISIIIISLLLHAVVQRWVRNFSLYAIMFISLLIILLLVYGISIFLVILLTIFLVWRQIVHDEEADAKNQKVLIVVMLSIFIFDIYWMYDEQLIWIALTFLIVLIAGYMVSNISHGRNGYHQLKFIGFTIASMLIGGILLYLLYDVIQPATGFLWSSVAQLLMIFSKGIAYLIDVSPLEIEGIREMITSNNTNNVKMEMPDEIPRSDNEDKVDQAITDSFSSWWLLSVFVASLLILLFFFLKKKHMSKNLEVVEAEGSVSQSPVEKRETKNRLTRSNSKKGWKVDNEIRKQVMELEELAFEKGYGRLKYETIEEWLERLELNTSQLKIYQNVRYGNKYATEEETVYFKEEISRIKAWLQTATNSRK